MYNLSNIHPCYVTCICCWYNTCSDRPVLGVILPWCPQVDYRPAKTKQKSHTINKLLTLNTQSLWEISNLCLAVLTLLSLGQYGKVLVWHLLIKTSFLVSKWFSLCGRLVILIYIGRNHECYNFFSLIVLA